MKESLSKKLAIWAVVVLGVLSLPFIMKAPWTVGDYVFAGVVLFGSACVYETVTKNMKQKQHRFAVGIAVILFIICIWGLAVSGS